LLTKWSGMPNRRSTSHSAFRFAVSHSYTRSTNSLCLAQLRSFSLKSSPVSVGRGSSRRANRVNATSAKTDNETLPGTYGTPGSNRGGRFVRPVRTGQRTDTTGRTDRTTDRVPYGTKRAPNGHRTGTVRTPYEAARHRTGLRTGRAECPTPGGG